MHYSNRIDLLFIRGELKKIKRINAFPLLPPTTPPPFPPVPLRIFRDHLWSPDHELTEYHFSPVLLREKFRFSGRFLMCLDGYLLIFKNWYPHFSLSNTHQRGAGWNYNTKLFSIRYPSLSAQLLARYRTDCHAKLTVVFCKLLPTKNEVDFKKH